MANSFYQQIEDEEASRLAKQVVSEAKLREVAESSRREFYFCSSPMELTLSGLAFGVIVVYAVGIKVGFWPGLGLGVLLAELNWTQAKLKATSKLLLIHLEKTAKES